MNTIRIAESAAEIQRCFPIVQQLRPHLSEAEFVPRVRRQALSGYHLAYLESEGTVRAVAGFRFDAPA